MNFLVGDLVEAISVTFAPKYPSNYWHRQRLIEGSTLIGAKTHSTHHTRKQKVL